MRDVMNASWRSAYRVVPRRRHMRSLAPAVGAVGAFMLHAFVLGSLAFGWGGRISPPHSQDGLGANAIASTEEAVATLILIEEPGVGPRDEDSLEKLASHGVVLQNFRLTIVSPDPSINAAIDDEQHPDEQAPAETPSSGDRQRQAALFGRYIGQIQARVERAWLRPRTPIGADSFECRVQVLQNARGEVQEVTVQRCNGDVRWGLSLVRAIERASPLPAPPDPSVFAETLQLSFHSEAFVGDEEGFEADASRQVRTTADQGSGI